VRRMTHGSDVPANDDASANNGSDSSEGGMVACSRVGD
jgi:hypothetical protein